MTYAPPFCWVVIIQGVFKGNLNWNCINILTGPFLISVWFFEVEHKAPGHQRELWSYFSLAAFASWPWESNFFFMPCWKIKSGYLHDFWITVKQSVCVCVCVCVCVYENAWRCKCESDFFSYDGTIKQIPGNSLMVQWLELHTCTAEGIGSIPGQGTTSYTAKNKK